MNSIRDQPVALDTNVFIFALRRRPKYPACATLVFEKLPQLKLYVPVQILVELNRNLTDHEMREGMHAISRAGTVTWDYAPAPPELLAQWKQRGAKKGDAVIAARLEAAQVSVFVSENRHFLAGFAASPFRVLSSALVVQMLR